jgi:hypothetical protein
MLTLAHNTRIYVYRPATDLRKSFDGLTGLVRSAFRTDPRDGSWFLFFNKRRDRLKILAWEPDGFSIWYKRLEAGSFEPLRGLGSADTLAADALELDATALTLLLSGVNTTAPRRKRFAAPTRGEPAPQAVPQTSRQGAAPAALVGPPR